MFRIEIVMHVEIQENVTDNIICVADVEQESDIFVYYSNLLDRYPTGEFVEMHVAKEDEDNDNEEHNSD